MLADKISGGMFNPAVTIAVYLSNGKLFKEWQLVIMVVLSQVCGAYFGIFYAHMVLGAPELLCPFDQATGCVTYDSFGKVFLLELWCTFFFCLCILCQCDERSQESTDGVLKAGAIAFTLMAMISTAGAITGGCFNPAFGLT
jgi:glycerol uptake facilitator-like aquaporin